MRDFLKTPWAPLLIGSFIVLLMVAISRYSPQSIKKSSKFRPVKTWPADSLQADLSTVFSDLRLTYKFNKNDQGDGGYYNIQVHRDLPMVTVQLRIQECLGRYDAVIISAPKDPISQKLMLNIGWADSVFFRIFMNPIQVSQDSGKIALLIDDFGDRWDGFIESFCYLGGKISVSVLPGRPLSERVALEMDKRGCEVLLHMPMEPTNANYSDNGYMVLASMTKEDVQAVVRKALSEIPTAVGMNNHMGSRITENRKMMRYILSVIQEHRLYFVDSRTTGKSVAYDVACEMNLPCAKKHYFIDNKSDPAEIRKWLYTLVQKAGEDGQAVGIGHCHRSTLQVLQEEIPKIQKRGFIFVGLSDIVR